jgi:hypothetical protein
MTHVSLPDNINPGLGLSENALLNEAMKQTGLSDFGDDRFREGLRVLLESLNGEANLSDFGRMFAGVSLSNLLVNRLRVTEDIKRNPDILDVKIDKPMIIISLPRTGSTILHKLMAEDPDNRYLATWEANLPSPPPRTETYYTDPRIAQWDELISTSNSVSPGIERMHPVGAALPEECHIMQAMDFQSQLFNYQFDVRSYNLWLEEQDLLPVYKTHRMMLQYLQWRNPRKRWILKSVGHIWALKEIYEVYPDAQVIQTHRDPNKAVASLCSLLKIPLAIGTDVVDEKGVAAHWATSWEKGLRKTIEFRDSGVIDDNRIVDVKFDEFMKDPVGMVQKIYNHFNVEYTSQAKRCVEAFMNNNPRDKHGTHTYTLEQFGLDPQDLKSRYQFYTDRFGLECKFGL